MGRRSPLPSLRPVLAWPNHATDGECLENFCRAFREPRVRGEYRQYRGNRRRISEVCKYLTHDGYGAVTFDESRKIERIDFRCVARGVCTELIVGPSEVFTGKPLCNFFCGANEKAAHAGLVSALAVAGKRRKAGETARNKGIVNVVG